MENILRSKNDLGHCPCDNMGQYVWKSLQELDDQSVCLIEASTDEHLTVSELKSRVISIAMALIKRGIVKTDKIIFSGENSIQHLILLFATYFIGNTFVRLYSWFKMHEVEQEVRHISPNIAIISAKEINNYKEIVDKNSMKFVVIFNGKHDKYITYEQLLEEGRDQTLEKIPYFDVMPEDILYMVYTSGTSGAQKLAMISNRMHMNASQFVRAPDVTQTPIGTLFELDFMSGIRLIPVSILRGHTVVMFNASDEELIFKWIEKYKIKTFKFYPYFGQRILEEMEAKNYDLSSLRLISTGGAIFPAHLANALHHRHGLNITQGYGMTEYTGIASNRGSGDDEGYLQGCVGKVLPGNELKIIDMITGESLGAGIDGEVCVRGCKVFSGYYNNDGASNELIDGQGWLHTGDIGHYDHKERLFITGRRKELIDTFVDNLFDHVHPEEVELFLLTHTAIADAVVVGVNNKTLYQCLRAYVVLKSGQTVSPEEIQKYVSDTLSSVKHLKAGVVFVDRMQRTRNKKIDRKYYKNLVKNEVID